MAILIKSAAVPCIGVLTAALSASDLIFELLLSILGRYLLLFKRVVTYPFSLA